MIRSTHARRWRAAAASGTSPLRGIQSMPRSNGRTTRSVVAAASLRSHAWKIASSIPPHAILRNSNARDSRLSKADEAGQAPGRCRNLRARVVSRENNSQRTSSRHGSSNRVGFFFDHERYEVKATTKEDQEHEEDRKPTMTYQTQPTDATDPAHQTQLAKTEVGILGATGAVGQQFIALLADHPWFKV